MKILGSTSATFLGLHASPRRETAAGNSAYKGSYSVSNQETLTKIGGATHQNKVFLSILTKS